MGDPAFCAKLSDDLLELFASGVDLYVATCSADRIPESRMGMGIRVHPDRRTVTVFIPTAEANTTLANLRDNGRVAATLCRPTDLRTVQLKGQCLAVRDATEADRALQEIFRAALVTTLATIGVPRAVTRSLSFWPSVAVDFRVEDVFTQTPGPQAGARIPE